MRRRTLVLSVPLVVVAAAAAALAGGEGEGAKPEETVKALRFRQLIVESGLDFAHGGGRWHEPRQSTRADSAERRIDERVV